MTDVMASNSRRGLAYSVRFVLRSRQHIHLDDACALSYVWEAALWRIAKLPAEILPQWRKFVQPTGARLLEIVPITLCCSPIHIFFIPFVPG